MIIYARHLVAYLQKQVLSEWYDYPFCLLCCQWWLKVRQFSFKRSYKNKSLFASVISRESIHFTGENEEGHVLYLAARANKVCQSLLPSRKNLLVPRGECGERSASSRCAFGPCLCTELWGPAVPQEGPSQRLSLAWPQRPGHFCRTSVLWNGLSLLRAPWLLWRLRQIHPAV